MEFTQPYNLLHYLHCLHIGRFASVYIATWWERYGNMASEQKGGVDDVGDCYDYEHVDHEGKDLNKKIKKSWKRTAKFTYFNLA